LKTGAAKSLLPYPEMIAGVVRAYMEALKIVFALSIPVPSP
jgi:hypothetical protein